MNIYLTDNTTFKYCQQLNCLVYIEKKTLNIIHATYG